MELLPKQQIVETLKKAESILLIGHSGPSGDSVGSLLAFGNILRELGKKPRVVISDEIPGTLKFLPGVLGIDQSIDKARDLVFKIDVEGLVIEKISTKTDGKTLEISITPKKGELNKEKTVVAEGKFKYDCIVVLNTSDLDKIDRVYRENTELFMEAPIINIDHHAGNEYFGTVNLVDMAATSTAEILVAIFEALGKSKVDENTATLLLTGIMADTESFRGDNTTPKSLTVSAQLLASGARKKEIVENLYGKVVCEADVQEKAIRTEYIKKEIPRNIVTATPKGEKFEEKEGVEGSAGNVSQDVISKAIESLEAAEAETTELEKDHEENLDSEQDETVKKEDKESIMDVKAEVKSEPKAVERDSGVKVYYEEATLMPIGEILKKFSPADKEKLEEFKKKNEISREKLKKEKSNDENQ